MVQVGSEDKDPIRVHPALSPNGDGINDFLIIEGIKDFNENKIVVFTRLGLKVFEMKNYDNKSKVFKGIGNVSGSNGNLPEGTYFYILEYKYRDKWKMEKGWFELKI